MHIVISSKHMLHFVNSILMFIKNMNLVVKIDSAMFLTEALHQAKSKQRGNLHAEGEGDGWDTASEGDEVVGEEKNASSSNEKSATTSGSTEDHFEDALTEEELRAVCEIQNTPFLLLCDHCYATISQQFLASFNPQVLELIGLPLKRIS